MLPILLCRFHIDKDPYEQNNIVQENIEVAEGLKLELDHVYNELIASDNLIDPPRIIIGSEYENLVILNRNDAGGQRGIWAQEEIFGNWKVSINEGCYNIRFKFIKPVGTNGRMYLETGTIVHQIENEKINADIIEMKNVYLPKMDCNFTPTYSIGYQNIFPF